MTEFWGMDTAQVRDHAERLCTASGEVEELAARLGAAVHGVRWTGADAEAFRGRWSALASRQLVSMVAELRARGEDGLGQADQQDVASAADGSPTGTSGGTIPPVEASPSSRGPLRADRPGIPAEFEDPAEGALSDLAGWVSDGIGWGVDTGIDLLEGGLGLLGANTHGIAQLQRDADHLGGVLEDWATGERVPTIAELGAAGLLTTGSAGVGAYEAVTGEDTALFDDRPGGIVESVRTESIPTPSPQTLQDLIAQNDALRLDTPGGPLENGRIGIQEVHRADGGEPAYIVQIPPTEGADLTDVPGAYGGQGNSRDWSSNLRLIAGQHPAAMDDVRAAMASAEVPPGAQVLIVGHSQGGIVANRLSADPTFNSSSGQSGTYHVTHTVAVGSPVQTSVPAQGSTQSVSVHHAGGIGPEGISGDLIPGLDLGGLQVDGGTLGAPNRHEVSLPGYPVPSIDLVEVLASNHDSVGPDGDADAGYSGSVGRATASDPTLSALQDDLTGVYLGDGTVVARSHVVTVGRGAP
ncbi:hypothetical protein [Brachybacterium sp. YJGR34]|uniref:hypothetical protein n=1 Tax=Brachybacterium sp. YJGR34 TaxID=2059911 RepID=UPI000E0AAD3B|nr:hypothetical protein [Brachybacterium sp. YJGR34]